MSVSELRELLERVEDTREVVLRPGTRGPGDPLAVWRSERAGANAAFERWRRVPGPEAYAAYRAAEDRADAAELSLRAHGRPREARR